MEDTVFDLISKQPPEILARILASLPLKQAVRTSVLSTAWRNLWAPLQVDLSFASDCQEAAALAMATFSRSSYQSPRQWKFLLRLPENNQLVVVLATVGVDNKELHLNLCNGEQAMGSSSAVFRLSLGLPAPSTSRLSSLQSLHLRSVTPFSKNLASAFFSNCPLVQHLKVENCMGLQSITLDAGNCLESFTVTNCLDMVSIKISAPNLKSFEYRGVLPSIQLSDASDLIQVVLDLRDGPGYIEFDCEELVLLLASLKEVEILSITGWLFEWMCLAGVIFGRLEFRFIKLKELRWVDSVMNRTKRDSLACFLNCTTSLEELCIEIDPSLRSFPHPFIHHFWHEPHLWMDYETVKCNASPLAVLKSVKLVGFTDEEDELLMMDLLLSKGVTLESMTVRSPENHSWRVSKVPLSQIKQTSGSCLKHKVVSAASNMEYCFRFTREDHGRRCM